MGMPLKFTSKQNKRSLHEFRIGVIAFTITRNRHGLCVITDVYNVIKLIFDDYAETKQPVLFV